MVFLTQRLLSKIFWFSPQNHNFYPFSSEQFRMGMIIIGAMAEHQWFQAHQPGPAQFLWDEQAVQKYYPPLTGE